MLASLHLWIYMDKNTIVGKYPACPKCKGKYYYVAEYYDQREDLRTLSGTTCFPCLRRYELDQGDLVRWALEYILLHKLARPGSFGINRDDTILWYVQNLPDLDFFTVFGNGRDRAEVHVNIVMKSDLQVGNYGKSLWDAASKCIGSIAMLLHYDEIMARMV